MFVDAHGMVIASSSQSEVGTSLFTRFDDTRDEFQQALHRAPRSPISAPITFRSESKVLNRDPRWPSSRGLKIELDAQVRFWGKSYTVHCIFIDTARPLSNFLTNPDAFAVTPCFECVNLKAAIWQFVN
jgi:hypothetical protein